MNTRTTLLGCCLATLLATPAARAGEKIDKTLPADADGVVAVDNLRGSIDIVGWDRNEVHIEGELDDLAEGLVFEHEGKRTRIEVKLPEDNIDNGDGSTLTIHLPMGSQAEVRSVSADTTMKDVRGGIAVRTVSGDLRATGLGGELLVKSVSGDVKMEAIQPGHGAQLKTVSGDMSLALANRELDLSTVSGDVELALAEFDRLGITTVSGDLSVSGKLAPKGRIECKTVSGICELHLRGKVDARISARTGPGGEIVNSLNGTRPEEEFPAQQRLDATLGDGSGSITASTVSGEIVLKSE